MDGPSFIQSTSHILHHPTNLLRPLQQHHLRPRHAPEPTARFDGRHKPGRPAANDTNTAVTRLTRPSSIRLPYCYL